MLRHAVDRCRAHSLDAGAKVGRPHRVETSAEYIMATTRLPSSLRESLGPHAAEDLVTIIDEIRAEHASFRAEFAESRREVNARFDRMDERFQSLEIKLGDVKADLMKWSFVFWVGAVTAIAVLAGVLDR